MGSRQIVLESALAVVAGGVSGGTTWDILPTPSFSLCSGPIFSANGAWFLSPGQRSGIMKTNRFGLKGRDKARDNDRDMDKNAAAAFQAA